MKKYSAKYKDEFGEEDVEILSDGSTLYLTLRGITFSGTGFELLEGVLDESKFEYEKYADGSAVVTNFDLETYFPITLMTKKGDDIANVKALIGAGSKKGSLVYLELTTKRKTFKNTKSYQGFEEAFVEIQSMVPRYTNIKTCLSCRYSNYNPYGNGIFGDLHCFKNVKPEAEKISSKFELLDLWEKAVLEQKLFNVNEMFLCSEYQLVKKGDWVYKSYLLR